jgi:transposase-like protein
MARYIEERRQAVVAKLLPRQSPTPQEVAEQEGISLPTIYKWRGEARAAGCCMPNAGVRGAGDWSSEDRLAAVLESASMNAEETAAYCRRRGLYAEQLMSWQRDCEQAGSLLQQQRRR